MQADLAQRWRAGSAVGLISCGLTTVFGTPPAAATPPNSFAINGVYRATSNGDWATTNDVYHEEATVTSIWTVQSTCTYPEVCEGNSHQRLRLDRTTFDGQRALVRADALCPVGSRARTAAPLTDRKRIPFIPSTAPARSRSVHQRSPGKDTTIGPSGACGVNQWLAIRMPFTLTRILLTATQSSLFSRRRVSADDQVHGLVQVCGDLVVAEVSALRGDQGAVESHPQDDHDLARPARTEGRRDPVLNFHGDLAASRIDTGSSAINALAHAAAISGWSATTNAIPRNVARTRSHTGWLTSTNIGTSCSWRKYASATSALLDGKYLYALVGDTPARAATARTVRSTYDDSRNSSLVASSSLRMVTWARLLRRRLMTGAVGGFDSLRVDTCTQ